MVVCESCEGSGFQEPHCHICGRDGWVEDPDDGGYMTCPACNGDASEPCRDCEGTGEVDE